MLPNPDGATVDPFDALGDPNRREILRLLGDGAKPVREIAGAMTISRPAVSRHLRLLKDAGMVAEDRQGTQRIYHLEEEGLHAVQAYLEGSGARRRPGSAWSPRTPRGSGDG